MLYDEGFSRDIDYSGSVIKDIYESEIVYGVNTGENDILKITIKLWYSYGYGKTYFDIGFSVYLSGYGFIIIDNVETDFYRKLQN